LRSKFAHKTRSYVVILLSRFAGLSDILMAYIFQR